VRFGRLLCSATAAVPAGGAKALTISSGSQTPSWMALTRFTGALLGVKRSMVVMAASLALWAAQTGQGVTVLLSCVGQLLQPLHAGAYVLVDSMLHAKPNWAWQARPC
jgi:hypothetical protein